MLIRPTFFSLLLAIAAMLPATLQAAQFAVFYSNDVHGEIEPCG